MPCKVKAKIRKTLPDGTFIFPVEEVDAVKVKRIRLLKGSEFHYEIDGKKVNATESGSSECSAEKTDYSLLMRDSKIFWYRFRYYILIIAGFIIYISYINKGK